MADNPDTAMEVATHVASAAGGGGLLSVIMSWLRNREAQQTVIILTNLQNDMARVLKDLDKMANMASQIVTLANKVDALHDRLDGVEDRIERMEHPEEGARKRRRRS